MRYTIILSSHAEKTLDKLPEDVRHSILKKIKELAEEPHPLGVKKLKGRQNE